MSTRLCDVDGCDIEAFCRGWCEKHYGRWTRHGDPTTLVGPTPDDSPLTRVLRRCQATVTGCIEWLGPIHHPRGYGQISVSNTSAGVHRIAYEAVCGPIPDGHQIDHLCRNPVCVNPAHLEAVTPEENNRRSMSPSAVNARKVACIHGHPLSGDNLYVTPSGRRRCVTCRRIAKRKARAR